ncbi:hypothetical protein FTO70_11525 [Methanosarcina sp. KYL-1]|uniref:hypothetical protein n=1 Tax=Methanosarcina sp. KYL-1 TaxID=2602068 RepID=UPI0021007327|nr:hypothetical protein [Methanosarcina sp. KYL-1]MCQ1536296.1 hypothetical protein [Methanosarcina sp. KYL-1]
MKKRTAISVLLTLALIIFGAGCVSDSGNGEDTSAEEGVDEEGPETQGTVEEGEAGDAEDAEFKALMQSANANYVKALVSTSKKDYNASATALEGLVSDLEEVKAVYVENPPAVYAADEKWPETLDEALAIAVSSQEYLLENDIGAAHEALEPMRDIFFELHQRNGINLMGDRLTSFHTLMEIAIEDANKNDTAAVVALIPELEAQWEGVSNAETPESADENYEASLDAVELKIHELETAATLKDEEETKKVAEEMRQAFAQVFAKYGVVIA